MEGGGKSLKEAITQIILGCFLRTVCVLGKVKRCTSDSLVPSDRMTVSYIYMTQEIEHFSAVITHLTFNLNI